jgi:hypothetical protein
MAILRLSPDETMERFKPAPGKTDCAPAFARLLLTRIGTVLHSA